MFTCYTTNPLCFQLNEGNSKQKLKFIWQFTLFFTKSFVSSVLVTKIQSHFMVVQHIACLNGKATSAHKSKIYQRAEQRTNYTNTCPFLLIKVCQTHTLAIILTVLTTLFIFPHCFQTVCLYKENPLLCTIQFLVYLAT